MSWLIRDLQFGMRQSMRRPAFMALGILTLALGIGSVTAMYSVIYNVLMNPFPYAQPRRMVDVVIQDTAQKAGGIRGALSVPEFRAYVDKSDVFDEAVGTETSVKQGRMNGHGTEDIVVGAATPNLFHFLGVKPLLGRVSTPEDAKPGAPLVAVMSYQAWMANFGGDPATLGQTIVVDGQTRTIIGIMPQHFAWNTADVWISDQADSSDPRPMERAFWLQGRLKRGISLQQAQTKLNVVAGRLARLYPERYPTKFTIKVLTVIDWVVGKFRAVLYTLFGAVGLLLMIACCNVGNMLLARATAREREIAIRAAVGATRFQILRQLLVESSLLSLSAGVVGVLFAYGEVVALAHFMPPHTIPVETVIDLKMPVLAFALGSAAVTTLLFGVAPALHATRKNLTPGLTGSGKSEGGSGSRHGGLRDILVVAEVALSLILLVGAGHLMRSFLSMMHLELGFDAAHIIALPPRASNATWSETRPLIEAITAHLRALPGVTAVGLTSGLPPYGGSRTELEVLGKTHSERWLGSFEACDSEYFKTIGLRFLKGEPFSRYDEAIKRKVAVVNQTLATRYFGRENPIGKLLQVDDLHTDGPKMPKPVFEIIGVVADIRNEGLEEATVPEVFLPATVASFWFPQILVRTSVESHALTGTIRGELQRMPKDLRQEPVLLEDLIARYSYSRPRFSVFVMSVFASVGLVLVATGIYGVMAYAVSQRTREIGIRIALGAGHFQIFADVLGGAVRLISLGLVGGMLGGFLMNRLLMTQVWTDDAGFDPWVLAGCLATIVTLGFVASYLPALRATKVQPLAALRHE